MASIPVRESPPEERLPNEDHWVDFDDSINPLNVGSFIYGKIIPDLESQLEIEGKAKKHLNTKYHKQSSVDNFSNFKVKRSEVLSTELITWICHLKEFKGRRFGRSPFVRAIE